jgi:hypothetical protein
MPALGAHLSFQLAISFSQAQDANGGADLPAILLRFASSRNDGDISKW